MIEEFLVSIEKATRGLIEFSSLHPLDMSSIFKSQTCSEWGSSIIGTIPESGTRPLVTYRQGGDSNILVDYGHGSFDINFRCRVTALEKALLNQRSAFATPEAENASDKTSVSISYTTAESITPHVITTVGCCNSLLVTYDPIKLPREKLLDHLQTLERTAVGDLSEVDVPTRLFKLPITFESKEQKEATERYMQTQRPHAPYLPDNLRFVAENNAFSAEHLKQIFLTGLFMAVVVGFYSGNTVSLPVDPRQRMSSPKTNPSRVFTPAGTVGWGGGCFSIYPVDSPGGYQMLGRTVPTFDPFGRKRGFLPGLKGRVGGVKEEADSEGHEKIRPWLFEPTDLISFYEVTSGELDKSLSEFNAGKYEFKYENTSFSMKQHNQLLKDTAHEVENIRRKQRQAQVVMVKAEEESLKKWREEREREKPNLSEVSGVIWGNCRIILRAHV